MDKYIIVTTLCNNRDIADKIIDKLLKEKLVAGSQLSEVTSKYWWNDAIEEVKEYKLEFRTKEILFSKIESVIKSIHDYEVAEISSCEIKNGSKEFYGWIDENIKQ